MDDRTRALAAVWLLKHEQPKLMLLHFVDLDSKSTITHRSRAKLSPFSTARMN